MIGLGTLINVAAIILGGLIGLLLKNNFKDSYKLVLIQGVGLAVIIIGISGSLNGLAQSSNKFLFLIIISSIIIGSVIGAFIGIEKRLNKLGEKVQKKFSKRNENFAKGFVMASLIFCVGAMAIVGSMQDGMDGDYSTLATKAILDGITTIVLTSKFGYGVIFSFVPVLIYQGTITGLAHFFGQFIGDSIKNQMSIIGNILILGIGLELLEIKKLKIADMLPAIFMPIFINVIIALF